MSPFYVTIRYMPIVSPNDARSSGETAREAHGQGDRPPREGKGKGQLFAAGMRTGAPAISQHVPTCIVRTI